MSFEEELIEHLSKAISDPGEASSTERYMVETTREQYEDYLRSLEETRATGNYLLFPSELPEDPDAHYSAWV